MTEYKPGKWQIVHDDMKVVPKDAIVLDPSGALSAFSEHGLRATVPELKAHGFDLTAQVMAEIEAQTRPTIEEPQGLGAVVEDEQGDRWVRSACAKMPWLSADGSWMPRGWDIIPAPVVRVLFEGVQP